MGMRVIRVGMQKMWGIRVGMRGMRVIREGIMGMREIRVGMMGTRVGMQENGGGGNEGNKRENLRTEVQLMNYNCGEGQETKNCVFRIIV